MTASCHSAKDYTTLLRSAGKTLTTQLSEQAWAVAPPSRRFDSESKVASHIKAQIFTITRMIIMHLQCQDS